MFHVIVTTTYGYRSMGVSDPPPAIVATRRTERSARQLAARLAKLSACAATVYTVQRAA